MGISKEFLELVAVGGAARLLSILLIDVLAVRLGIAAQVGYLIISALAFVLSRNTGVKGNFLHRA